MSLMSGTGAPKFSVCKAGGFELPPFPSLAALCCSFFERVLPQTLSFFLSSLRCSTERIDRVGILMNFLPFLCLNAFLPCSPNFLVEMLKLVLVLSPFYILLEIDKYLGLHERWSKFPIFETSSLFYASAILVWMRMFESSQISQKFRLFLSLANFVNDHASDSVFFKLPWFLSI